MTVMVLERVPAGVRGELTRWMLEPKTGVFVGEPSGLVREKLWAQVGAKLGGGAALLIYSSDAEQGFVMESYGDTSRRLVDFEGLWLVQV